MLKKEVVVKKIFFKPIAIATLLLIWLTIGVLNCFAGGEYKRINIVPTAIQGEGINIQCIGKDHGGVLGSPEDHGLDVHQISINEPTGNYHVLNMVEYTPAQSYADGDYEYVRFKVDLTIGSDVGYKIASVFVGNEEGSNAYEIRLDARRGMIAVMQFNNDGASRRWREKYSLNPGAVYRIYIDDLDTQDAYSVRGKVIIQELSSSPSQGLIVTEKNIVNSSFEDLGLDAIEGPTNRHRFYVGTRLSNAKFWKAELQVLARD